MASHLDEENNFIRLELLLKRVSPRAVRTFFNKEFPPSDLPLILNENYGTLQDLHLRRILNQPQWKLLFPQKGVPAPDSKDFDVTLMICLIRHLSSSVKPPINGFDELPLPIETLPGPDLARIKWYRNILAHDDRNPMTACDFNTAWTNIENAVSRLGGFQMKQECQNLKVKILDQSDADIMLEIKQIQEEIKELRQSQDIDHSTVAENLRCLQDSHNTLQTEHSRGTENLRCLQDSHNTLQTEHSRGTENLRCLQDSHNTLQTEHSRATENQRCLQDSHNTLQTEHSRTTEYLRDLQDSHISLQRDHASTSNMLKGLKDSHNSLQIEQSKTTEILEDPIPWNIKGQIKDELENWKKDDITFIETNGARSVLKMVKENGCVVVTASSGSGKSSMVRHVALQMQNEGYEILPISKPKEIIKWFNPSKKTLFVGDNICGTYTLNPIQFDKWEYQMEKIKTLIENKPVKLIMSCRLQVYKDEQMKSLSFFQTCECNILSPDLRLTKKEKQSIAKFYLQTHASKIIELYDKFDCFPLLCQLYSKNEGLNILDFFNKPFAYFKDEVDKLEVKSHGKYCALALCVMFNNHLKEEWLTKDPEVNIKTVLRKTYTDCKLQEGTSGLVLRNELDSLTQTFIKKDGEVYSIIHDKLFDFFVFYFGSKMLYSLINNAVSQLISERFVFEKKNIIDEFSIIVPDEYQQMYMKRMVDDWSRGNIVYVFCNINMCNQIFRQTFLKHIKHLELSKQKQLACIYDIINKSTPLIQCSFKGYIDFVNWCIHQNISNVNHSREDDGVAPIYTACQEGHTEVVKVLINTKADIDKCIDNGESPLGIACQQGHTEVVQILIDNGSDINKCINTGASPLYIACQQGHSEIVQLLINMKAHINKCRDNGATPLYTACQQGHHKIVDTLINNNADINKCKFTEACETSPLFIACQEGHTKVVDLLINNKADINKRRGNALSPLLIACIEGHTEIVRILLDKGVDISRCKITGASPIYVAYHYGHIELAEFLSKHKP